jgi:hypothetical protein
MSAAQHHIDIACFMRAAALDPIISPTHISIYLALYTCWIGQNCVNAMSPQV